MIKKIEFTDSEVGLIPKDWGVGIINEITKKVVVGFVGTCSKFYCDEKNGIPMIRTTNLTKKGINYDDLKFVTKDFHEKNKKSQLYRNDILIARFGKSGLACLFEKDTESNCLNVVIIKPDETKCLPKFLLYCFNSKIIQNQTSANLVGTIMDILNTKTIMKFFVPLPTIKEQELIVKILSDLDSKMEINRQMNKTLEEICRTIFQQWFVDFESLNEQGNPYKISNGKMIFNEELKKDIPIDWKVVNLNQEFNLVMGQSPPGSSYNKSGEGMIFFQGRTDFGIRFPTNRMYCTEPTRFAKKGDTLVSVRAPVGDINQAITDCCIGRGLASIKHKLNHLSYTYYSMKNLKPIFEGYEAEGTVFGAINKKSFEQIKILSPPEKIVHLFEILVNPLNKKIEENTLQIQSLSKIRDFLLPKLMTGKIRIPIEVK